MWDKLLGVAFALLALMLVGLTLFLVLGLGGYLWEAQRGLSSFPWQALAQRSGCSFFAGAAATCRRRRTMSRLAFTLASACTPFPLGAASAWSSRLGTSSCSGLARPGTGPSFSARPPLGGLSECS